MTEYSSPNFTNIALLFYFISLFLYIISRFQLREILQKGILVLLIITAVIQTGELLLRWIQSHHPPLSGMYESLLLFSWALIAAFVILQKFYKINSLSIFVILIEILFLAYANLQDKSLQPLVPVLKSNWLIVHVFVYMLGYGLMTIAFFTSVGFYFFYLQVKDENEIAENIEDESTKNKTTNKKETASMLDKITYKIIQLGFPLITMGIITGAVWANRTWGSYWSWDPKETSALITWCIYAIYLHLRYIKKWQGISNLLPILGFIAIVCTFLLLKYLPAASGSMHVYQ